MIPSTAMPPVIPSALGTDCFSLTEFCLFTVDVDPLRGFSAEEFLWGWRGEFEFRLSIS